MTLFDGDMATWHGTHGHPLKTNEAGEAWNFSRTPSGLVHGYVQNANERRLNIDRLGASRGADRVEGVTIVWCSRRPIDNELTIHGWYENAIVFRQPYKRPDGHRFGRWIVTSYFTASAEDVQLLPPELRNEMIPSHEPGTMGQSDILYVDETRPPLAASIRRYIADMRPNARRPARAPGTPPDQRGWGGGESPRHLALKLYVRDNPSCLGLDIRRKGTEEYVLPSLDGIDVVFRDGSKCFSVEVKPKNCGEAEHLRGLYQAVKYRALLSAEAADAGKIINCISVLVTEDDLSADHMIKAGKFDIVHKRVVLPVNLE